MRNRRSSSSQVNNLTANAKLNSNPNPKTKAMLDSLIWHKVAAISGMDALGLGTYGSHVFKPQDPAYKQVWQTASLYHLTHTAAPLTKNPTIFGGLLTTGILAFSGT